MNLESATLVLRTASLGSSGINVNNFNNDCTWNIDLQTVLGTIYHKYKRFKICLTSVGSGIPNPTLTDASRFVNVNLEGLQWVNSGYDTTNGAVNRNVIATTIVLNSTLGFSNNFTGEVGFVFNKPNSNNISFRVYLTNVSNNTINQVQYPNLCYCFSIYGIDE